MTEPDATTLDATVLEELRASVEGDRSFVVELIEAYLADGAGHVKAIEGARSADDAEAMVRPAHTLKSSSATLGAARLAATARELEMAARTGSLAGKGTTAAERVQAEWEATSDALRSWIAAGDDA